MKTGWKRIANVKITVFDLKGNVKEVTKIKNLLMTDGFNMVRDGLKGDISDLEIKDLAWGSSTTAPAVGQHNLVSETNRQAGPTLTASDDGELTTMTYLAPDTANAPPNIEELGWFAGVDADGSPGSGIMLGRVLYHKVKNNLESIQIERIDKIEEA